ncbi:hypothetical protein [Pedobacter sp. Leaf194]|nr:hypothetical protein [Pedobacter sp. Leaf194]
MAIAVEILPLKYSLTKNLKDGRSDHALPGTTGYSKVLQFGSDIPDGTV